LQEIQKQETIDVENVIWRKTAESKPETVVYVKNAENKRVSDRLVRKIRNVKIVKPNCFLHFLSKWITWSTSICCKLWKSLRCSKSSGADK